MRKKRGRKPRNSNAADSRSLSRMTASQMNVEDDDLDMLDFEKILKHRSSSKAVKKRKRLIESSLDYSSSLAQMAAVKEISFSGYISQDSCD